MSVVQSSSPPVKKQACSSACTASLRSAASYSAGGARASRSRPSRGSATSGWVRTRSRDRARDGEHRAEQRPAEPEGDEQRRESPISTCWAMCTEKSRVSPMESSGERARASAQRPPRSSICRAPARAGRAARACRSLGVEGAGDEDRRDLRSGRTSSPCRQSRSARSASAFAAAGKGVTGAGTESPSCLRGADCEVAEPSSRARSLLAVRRCDLAGGCGGEQDALAPNSHQARDIASLFWWMMGVACVGLALSRPARARLEAPRPPRHRRRHRGRQAGRALRLVRRRRRRRRAAGRPDRDALRRLRHLRDPDDAGAGRATPRA